MSSVPHQHYWELWSGGFHEHTGMGHARCVGSGQCPVGARAFTREQWAREVERGHVSPNSWGWASGTREHYSIPPVSKRGR